jgi:hypothetical protein
MRCAVLLSLAIAFVSTTDAVAQSHNKFAIGAQLSTRTAAGPDNKGHVGVSLLWRFGQSKTGWGWHYGLYWFSTDLERSIGGVDTEFGRLRVRPIMGGYGYTRVFGRTAVTGKVMGGYAWTSMRISPVAIDAYHNLVGAQTISVDASNTIVVIPEVSAWYNINEKLGLKVSSGYVMARPNVSVSSSAGLDKRRVRADNVTFKVGMVYSMF